jgi:hypothetical protein
MMRAFSLSVWRVRDMPRSWQRAHNDRGFSNGGRSGAYFKENATLSKNLNLNGNLAVLRCAVIALNSRQASHLSWPAIFELSGTRFAIPYNLVCNNAFK